MHTLRKILKSNFKQKCSTHFFFSRLKSEASKMLKKRSENVIEKMCKKGENNIIFYPLSEKLKL